MTGYLLRNEAVKDRPVFRIFVSPAAQAGWAAFRNRPRLRNKKHGCPAAAAATILPKKNQTISKNG
jgi:hypothetical protein